MIIEYSAGNDFLCIYFFLSLILLVFFLWPSWFLYLFPEVVGDTDAKGKCIAIWSLLYNGIISIVGGAIARAYAFISAQETLWYPRTFPIRQNNTHPGYNYAVKTLRNKSGNLPNFELSRQAH